MGSKQSIYVGNQMCSQVEAVATFKLVLNSGFGLLLENTFYVPSYSRNLVSISRLTRSDLSFHFHDVSFELINIVVGRGG